MARIIFDMWYDIDDLGVCHSTFSKTYKTFNGI